MIETTIKYNLSKYGVEPLDITKPFLTERGKKNTYLSPHLQDLVKSKLEDNSLYLDCKYVVEEHQTRFVIVDIFTIKDINIRIVPFVHKDYSSYISIVNIYYSFVYSDNSVSEEVFKSYGREWFEESRKSYARTPLEVLKVQFGKKLDLLSEDTITKICNEIGEGYKNKKSEATKKNNEVYEESQNKEKIGKEISAYFGYTMSRYSLPKFTNVKEIINSVFSYTYDIKYGKVEIGCSIKISCITCEVKPYEEDLYFSNTFEFSNFNILETEELAGRLYKHTSHRGSIYHSESNDGYRAAGYTEGIIHNTEVIMKQIKLYYLGFCDNIEKPWYLENMDTIFCASETF